MIINYIFENNVVLCILAFAVCTTSVLNHMQQKQINQLEKEVQILKEEKIDENINRNGVQESPPAIKLYPKDNGTIPS